MPKRPAHSPDVLPIVRLVREKVAAHGKGLRGFADDRGIPYSTIRYYHQADLEPLPQMPRPETRRQLAEALRISLDELEQAAVESLAARYDAVRSQPTTELDLVDKTIRHAGTVADAIRADPNLLPEAKEHLLRQYALLLRIRAETEEHVAADIVDIEEHALRAEMKQKVKRIKQTEPTEAPPAPAGKRGGPRGRGGR